MTHIIVALGTNLGDRLLHLQTALTHLNQVIQISQTSSVYESTAAYVEDQPAFLNAIVAGKTQLAPFELLTELKSIEQRMGRTQGLRYGPRIIDLDILVYGELILDSEQLQIPHPRIEERDFVLQPLQELAPDLVLPGFSRSIRELAPHAQQGSVLARVAPPYILWQAQQSSTF